MDLAQLKKRKLDFGKIATAVQDATGGKRQNSRDERFWKPTADDADNGFAVLRFLPAPKSDIPWVQWWDHGFQGPTGQWYIEKSLTTLGQPDPLAELNQRLWQEGDKETVRKRKRREHYTTNVLVISDPAKPENEGKVFMYSFGKKIMEMIKDQMAPEFPDETPVNPFDVLEGADFALKFRKVDGFRNYGKSEFRSPSPMCDGDEERINAVLAQLHDIGELTDPANFKTYNELKERLYRVIGEKSPSEAPAAVSAPAPVVETAPAPEPAPVAVAPEPAVAEEEDDDVMSYFNSLASDD